MRLTSFINNAKCIEWGLTMQQGALFDLLNQLHSWADPVTIDGDIYYWASKQMICDELPLAYNKVDTVYRALKSLSEKGLINYKKHGEKDCVSLTQKGKEWNSDSNPRLGNKSEATRKIIRGNSDLNPTYKNTNNNNTKINTKKDLDLSEFIEQPSDQVWNDYLEHRKNKKAKLTQSALNILIKNINSCVIDGFTTDEILCECMLRNWQGFKSDWMRNKSARAGLAMSDDTGWIQEMGNVL